MTRRILRSGPIIMLLATAGCGVTNQLHSVLDYRGTAIESQSASLHGIGVLTPGMPTGYESDKQALGAALGSALSESLPEGRVVALGDMLSAINTAGLARSYSDMLSEYEHTGILERESLQALGEAGHVRYLAKINLGAFDQSTDKRLSIAGIRMFDTWRATIRVHLEIWDGESGEIAWQGNDELVFAREGVKERPVSFSQVAKLAAEHLVDRLGESGNSVNDEIPPSLAASR